MKTRRLGITSCFLAILLTALAMACSHGPTVLVIARESATEFMIIHELRPMVAAMEKAGYRVDLATDSGKVLQVGEARLTPDLRVLDVDLHRYVGVIIPCLAAGSQPNPSPPALVALVHAAIEAHLPIAAQYSGIDLLVLAGNLGPKKIAANFRFASPDTPLGIVVDGNLVTSGTCPDRAREYNLKDGTRELMTRFIGLLPGRP